MRKNELFGDYPVLKLKNQQTNDWRWLDVEISKEVKDTGYQQLSNLAYALKDNKLLVRLNLKRKIDKDFGISVFLIGYKKNKDFAAMPKIQIRVGLLGLKVQDKQQKISHKQVSLKSETSTLFFEIPLEFLGSPDYIMASARSRIKDLPFEDTAWRILELEK